MPYYANDPLSQAAVAGQMGRFSPLSPDALQAERERLAQYGMPLQAPLQSQIPGSYPMTSGSSGGPSGQYNPYTATPAALPTYGLSDPSSGGGIPSQIGDTIWGAVKKVGGLFSSRKERPGDIGAWDAME